VFHSLGADRGSLAVRTTVAAFAGGRMRSEDVNGMSSIDPLPQGSAPLSDFFFVLHLFAGADALRCLFTTKLGQGYSGSWAFLATHPCCSFLVGSSGNRWVHERGACGCAVRALNLKLDQV
jgi:hypothetical protein